MEPGRFADASWRQSAVERRVEIAGCRFRKSLNRVGPKIFGAAYIRLRVVTLSCRGLKKDLVNLGGNPWESIRNAHFSRCAGMGARDGPIGSVCGRIN